jgi:hypothetical protein
MLNVTVFIVILPRGVDPDFAFNSVPGTKSSSPDDAIVRHCLLI